MTPEQLRELFTWDPVSGRIHWKDRYNGRPAFVSVQTQGYLYGKVFGKNYLAHRVLWALEHGEWPSGDIDHINQNKTDNRMCNLRTATKTENARNKTRNKNNTSGFVGVSKCKNKWRAYVTVDHKQMHLGLFNTKKQAHNAREKANAHYLFSPNHGTLKETL